MYNPQLRGYELLLVGLNGQLRKLLFARRTAQTLGVILGGRVVQDSITVEVTICDCLGRISQVAPVDLVVEFFAGDFAIAPDFNLWAVLGSNLFTIEPLPYAALADLEVGGQGCLADLVLGEVVGEFHNHNTRKTQRRCQQENLLHRSLGNL